MNIDTAEEQGHPAINSEKLPKESMETGKVKWFDRKKGYGYIHQDSGEEDLYVHINEVESSSLDSYDVVHYTVGKNKKGPCAHNVKKI